MNFFLFSFLSSYQIVSRYDIILILEVVDKRETSVKKFLEELNKSSDFPHVTL